MPTFDPVADLLQFRNRFVEQPHFPEGNAQVVMGLGVFVDYWRAFFQFALQLTKHLREIHAVLCVRRFGASTQRTYWSLAIAERRSSPCCRSVRSRRYIKFI